MNIADNLDRSARQFPDHPAIIFEDRQLTYGQLRAGRSGRLWAARPRYRRRRPLNLYLPNIPEFAIAYLAAQKIGAVVMAVNSMLTSEELRCVVDDTGARLLFTTAAMLPKLQGFLGDGLAAEQVIVCEGQDAGFMSLAALGAGDSVPLQPLALEPHAPAAILYMSGTTGQQKGASLSHCNVVANVTQTLYCLRTTPDDRLLLFHCFGQNFIMNAGLAAAATLVLHRRFELDEVLDSIEQNSITMLFAVPTVFITLMKANVTLARLASVRYCFSAAAALPLEVAERWKALYGQALHEGYGLTESSPFATYNHVWAHRPGSVGTPLPMVDVCILAKGGEGNRPLAPGIWGEICSRGPNVMLGYLDEDGYLYIVDRTKDMINAAGFKIWPREVEEILYQHPAIKECAVVGVPDAIKGEAAKTYVVLKPGVTLTAEALEAYCHAPVATYKVPHLYEFITELPKNPAGKILKRVLRDQASRLPVLA